MSKHLRRISIVAIVAVSVVSCALLPNGDDDAGSKNFQIKYNNPPEPFEKTPVSTADVVWQSKKSGSTIAVNSLCKKYQDISLDNLKKNILSGIDELNIKSTDKLTFEGRDAEKVIAEGSTDGIPVSMELVIFKKNNCNYDLALISRKSNFDNEKPVFDKFLEGFHVP